MVTRSIWTGAAVTSTVASPYTEGLKVDDARTVKLDAVSLAATVTVPLLDTFVPLLLCPYRLQLTVLTEPAASAEN